MKPRKLNSAVASGDLAKVPKGRCNVLPLVEAAEFNSCGIAIPYREQLLDPRWKKKRGKIIDRDGCACIFCNSSNRLEVHHCYYVAKRNAWEYPDDSLLTVCRDCHKYLTDQQKTEFTHWESAACALIRAVLACHKQNRGNL